VISDDDGRTTSTTIYTGGDCVHGPDLISTAAAAGRRAALAVYDDFHSRAAQPKSIAENQKPHPAAMSQAT